MALTHWVDTLQCVLLRSSPVLAATGALVQNKFVFVVQALGCGALQCLLQQLLRSSPVLAAAGEQGAFLSVWLLQRM
jgi:hypothetical protein